MFSPLFRGMSSKSISQGYKGEHKAYDVVSWYGKPLVAPESGTIKTIQSPDKIYEGEELFEKWMTKGYGVILESMKYEHLIWHLQPVLPVSEGEKVKKGQIIAYMGNSGHVSSGGRYVPVEERLGEGKPGTHAHWAVFSKETGKRFDFYTMVNWSGKVKYPLMQQIQDNIKAAQQMVVRIAKRLLRYESAKKRN